MRVSGIPDTDVVTLRTWGLFEKRVDQALCSPFHDLLLHCGVQWVTVDAEHVQLKKRAQLVGKLVNLIIKQEECLQARAHANLRW